jgi:hypothetical protein
MAQRRDDNALIGLADLDQRTGDQRLEQHDSILPLDRM